MSNVTEQRVTIKSYKGQSGFLDFIKEFKGGAHDFTASESTEGKDMLSKYGISKIKVFLKVEEPDSLKKLMSPPSPVVPLTIFR